LLHDPLGNFAINDESADGHSAIGCRYGPERASVRALGGESRRKQTGVNTTISFPPRRSPLFVTSPTSFSSSATHRGVGNEDTRACDSAVAQSRNADNNTSIGLCMAAQL